MAKDNAESRQTGEVVNLGTEKMDRRDFFVAAGKIIIPTLGILGLSLSGFTGKAQAADCSSTCAKSCFLTCNNNCEGFCKGGCGGTCKSTCEGSCFGGLKSFVPK